MEELFNEFLQDAKDLVADLESKMFEIDSNPSDLSLIREVFMSMHNLKGTAAMYGFENISVITHDLETIYDSIRNEEFPINKSIVDVTLKAIDIIKTLLENSDIIQDQNIFDSVKNEISQCNNIDIENIKPTSKQVENKNIYFLRFAPSKNIFERGLRIDSVFDELMEIASIFSVQNGEIIAIEEIEKNKVCNSSWDIILSTSKQYDDIEGIFMFFDEEEFKIIPLFANLSKEDLMTEIRSKIDDFTISSDLYDFYINLNGQQSDIEDIIEDISIEDELEVLVQKDIKSDPKISHSQDDVIKVSASKLDVLMNLVSELVTNKAQLNIIAQRINDQELNNSIESIDRLANQFRDNALSIRLIPLESLIVDFRRLVRDLSSTLNKKVEFEIEGASTELDKNVINGLKKPLMHIIRNAIDHGLESTEDRIKNNKTEEGIVKFIAFYSGADVFIQIQDDGKGIDIEAVRKKAIEKNIIKADDKLNDKEILNLIFLPGFTTAEKVSNISGRGVGMDVVKNVIEDLRGEIEITTERGLGTSFTIKLPITLSIINTLHVKVGETDFLIPLSDVKFCENKTSYSINSQSKKAIEVEGELIPFLDLHKTFYNESSSSKVQKVVIIQKEDKKLALIIDRIVGEHQAVLKPLGDLFKGQNFLSGASVMGDGSVSLVLDSSKLSQLI